MTTDDKLDELERLERQYTEYKAVQKRLFRSVPIPTPREQDELLSILQRFESELVRAFPSLLARVRAAEANNDHILNVAERRLSLLRNALESITSTAKEVKRINTQEFMEHIRFRAQEAEAAWNEDCQQGSITRAAAESALATSKQEAP
jgi:hypothetical protein